jgi:hypothetical protein
MHLNGTRIIHAHSQRPAVYLHGTGTCGLQATVSQTEVETPVSASSNEKPAPEACACRQSSPQQFANSTCHN